MATLSPLPWQFFDDNGKPLDGALLYSYEAGTTTPKSTFLDSAGYYANENPTVYDSAGRGIVWLGDGSYKFILKDKNGNQIGPTIDNVKGVDKLASVNSIVELRRLRAGVSSVVYLSGYYSVADGGGGWFYWDSKSTEDDNGGTIIEPNYVGLSGRWIRFIENNQVNPRWFGAKGDGTTDDTSAFNLASTFSTGDNKQIICDPGEYRFASDPDISCLVQMMPSAVFSVVGVTMTINPVIDQNDNTMHFKITGSGSFVFSKETVANSSWYGVELNGKCIENAAKSVVLNGGMVNVNKGAHTVSGNYDLQNVPINIMRGCHIVFEDGDTLSNLKVYGDPQWKIISCAVADTPTITAPHSRPEWFGCLINVNQDWSNAIQSAINSNSRVKFLKGTYYLNGITVNASTVLEGAGNRYDSVLQDFGGPGVLCDDGTTRALIRAERNYNLGGRSWINLKHLQIYSNNECDSALKTEYTKIGVYFRNTLRTMIDQCWVHSFSVNLFFKGCTQTEVRDCTIKDAWREGIVFEGALAADGVSNGSGNINRITNPEMQGNALMSSTTYNDSTKNYYNVRLTSGTNIIISGGEINGGRTLLVEGASSVTIHDVYNEELSYINTGIATDLYNIEIKASPDGISPKNIVFNNCYFANSPLLKAHLAIYSGSVTTNECHFRQCKNAAILLGPSALVINSPMYDTLAESLYVTNAYSNTITIVRRFTDLNGKRVVAGDCMYSGDLYATGGFKNIIQFVKTICYNTQSYGNSVPMLGASQNLGRFYPISNGSIMGLNLSVSRDTYRGSLSAKIKKNGVDIADTEVTLSTGRTVALNFVKDTLPFVVGDYLSVDLKSSGAQPYTIECNISLIIEF